MRKIFILAPLFLMLANCGTYNTARNAKKIKTKKIIVLDYAIEKSHLLVTETILDPKKVNNTKENISTEVEERKFLFTYDQKGQIINTYSCNIQQDKETNASNLEVELNTKKQITTLSLDNDADKLKVVYDNNLLHQISHYDPEFNELVLTTYSYDKQKLPVKAQLGNATKPNQIIDLSFKYDEKQNVKVSTYDNEVMTLSYDDKKYLLSGQPYYNNPFYYLSIDWLTFTHYSPKNNIIKAEDNDYIITIDYTYNEEDMPLTAKITKTSKSNNKDSRVTAEQEFYYKEIEVPITK